MPEAQVANVAPGQLVNARLPAFAGEVLEGTIQAVLPQANLDSRTVRVRVELPNPQRRLRPGMTAEVTLSRNVEDALVIPSEAVIRTGRRALVMLAEEKVVIAPLRSASVKSSMTKQRYSTGWRPGRRSWHPVSFSWIQRRAYAG